MSSAQSKVVAYAKREILRDGEEILWTGKPDPTLRLLSVIHWVLLAGVGFAVLELGNAPVRFVIFEALALVGLWGFLALRGQGIHYLITPRRVILIKAGGDFRNHSYAAPDLRHAKPYAGLIGWVGGINFTGHEPFPGEWQGLWGLKAVQEVEALIVQIRQTMDDEDDEEAWEDP